MREAGRANGTPGGTRTPNLLVRSQALCPIELRVHSGLKELPHHGERMAEFKPKFFNPEASKRKRRAISNFWELGRNFNSMRVFAFHLSQAGAPPEHAVELDDQLVD